MIALLLLLGAGGEPDPLTLSEYRERVSAIVASLKAGELEAAKGGAKALAGLRVAHGKGTFAADGGLLGAVAAAKDLAEARALLPRLRALGDGLDAVAPRDAAPKTDPELLERLRRDQRSDEIERGGEVAGPRLHDPRLRLPESIADRILRFLEWLYGKIRDFLSWLLKFFFGESDRDGKGGGASRLTLVLVLLLASGLGLVAFLAWRRKRASPAPAPSLSAAPAMSESDEDPLSRSANEWERYAAELLKAGRYREAIRAGYHAVLVTLFRAGTLHYRKDRTNWEYAYALPPSTAWRPQFVEATRSFEFEWYGRRDTGAETADEFARQAQAILTAVRVEARR